MKLSNFFRKAALDFLHPVVSAVAGAYAPFSRKLISASDYRAILAVIKPGDVLVTKTRGEMASLFIPGEYSHAGVYAGGMIVCEAVSSGVKETDILEFVMKKDHITIVRPIFASADDIEAALRVFEEEILGLPYDWSFQPNNKAFFCTEMIWHIYSVATGGRSHFHRRDILGVETVIPDDFILAEKKFQKIYSVNSLEVN